MDRGCDNVSFESTIIADTQRLLQSGGVSVTVHSQAYNYDNIPSTRKASSTVETKTVHIFPKSGSGSRDEKGLLAEATHQIMFPLTSSVAVGHRIYQSGETDFFQVLRVDSFEDHKEIRARKVENRT